MESTSSNINASTTPRFGIQHHLAPWELYDASGAVNAAPDDEMKELFRRYRVSRGKRVEGASAQSLQYSWCAFINRWNTEPSFGSVLRDRESA